jgi:hypothetical protein
MRLLVLRWTDNRPRYARNDNGVRINDNVSNAIVLTNTDKGIFYSLNS